MFHPYVTGEGFAKSSYVSCCFLLLNCEDGTLNQLQSVNLHESFRREDFLAVHCMWPIQFYDKVPDNQVGERISLVVEIEILTTKTAQARKLREGYIILEKSRGEKRSIGHFIVNISC